MKYYSFDVFDTCFVRACGSPLNVFDLLAYKILGDDSEESHRMDFALIRINGERKARLASQKEEVCLDEIYNYCSFAGLTSIPNEQILQAEIETEMEQLVPVYSIQKKVKELHQNGHSVYYVSDMYLPQDVLSNLLKKHGFWKENDKLYVSSEYGITKHSGNLYRYIATQNQIPFKKWHHYGDNKYGDYKVPRKLGIKTTLIKHKYSSYERFVLSHGYFPGFFVNQHLAGISKAIRLSFPDTPQHIFAADLIAPLYVPFVYNILQNAQSKGIKKLFFLARDGYILYQIAKELICKFPTLKVNYLYVSRSSLYLPGLSEITTESLQSLTKTAFGFTNESKLEILKNFIDTETFEKIKTTSNKQTNIDLFSDLHILSILSQYHNQQRSYILKYFIQEGLADAYYKTAIVDVRGTRTCQLYINDILTKAGFLKTEAYYLEVSTNRKKIVEAGTYQASFYNEKLNKTSFLIYLSELGFAFEQYFSMSPHLRTIAYKENNGRIRPVFEYQEINEKTKDTVKIHEEISKMFSSYFIYNKLCLHLSSIQILSYALIGYFAQKPEYSYLKALHSIQTNNKANDHIYIVKIPSLNDIKKHRIDWWRGTLYYIIRNTWGSKFINKMFCFAQKISKRLHK